MALNLGNITLAEQLLVSYGIGTAAGPAIQPFAQLLANEAWELNALKPPPALYLAEGYAQGQITKADAYRWAKQQGFDSAQMDAMVAAANVGPGAAYAFEMWRRGLINKDGFDRALKRLGLEDQWLAGLEGLRDRLLSSEELAMAQQQGFVDLARANSEGALQGVTNERQQIRFDMAGLPPGLEMAMAMRRRGIIDQAEFAQIVREGHTKTKYTDELTALQRQILSAATAVRAHLKGHIDAGEMHTRGADWGYTAADMDLWYLSEGRPATAHQIHIGYARGADLPGATNEEDAIRTSVRQSDIRPEYSDLIYAGRATYPSLFQLTRLVTSGAIDAATGASWAHKSGLADEVVTALRASWSGTGGTPAGDTHIAKAQTQLWTTTHKSYVADEITDTDATTALGAAGVAAGSVAPIITLWKHERDLIRKQLTAAQIKKAARTGAQNPATGQPWTLDEAIARLIDLGYNADDAHTFMQL